MAVNKHIYIEIETKEQKLKLEGFEQLCTYAEQYPKLNSSD